MIILLTLFFLLETYGTSFCQNVNRPNIVMVMSDAFVSMKHDFCFYGAAVALLNYMIMI